MDEDGYLRTVKLTVKQLKGLISEAPGDGKICGQVRRLGETGPVYEVIRLVGDDQAEIQIPETGETAILMVAEILTNPFA